MIQGIQNVSFSGAKSKVANKALQKAEELYVSASSNLAGTVNAKRAERLSRYAVIFEDKDTFIGRVASMRNSKRPIAAPAAKTDEKIIPENSINFVC